MDKYRTWSSHEHDQKFDDKEIMHLHKLYHTAAPSGKMEMTQFKLYLNTTLYEMGQLAAFEIEIDPDDHSNGMAKSYEQLFRGYDRDQDKIISFEDFLKYHVAVIFSTPDLVDVVFDMYDEDGSGEMEDWELEEVVTNSTRLMWGKQYKDDPKRYDVHSEEVQNLVRAEVAKIINFVDEDNDGTISREEMTLATAEHPELLEKLKNLS